MNENESLTVTLTLDNDEELECAVLTIYEVEGQEYIALLPLDEEGSNDEGQVYLCLLYTSFFLYSGLWSFIN